MEDVRLVEGSEILLNCAKSGDARIIVMVMEGKQQVRCPKCGGITKVEFKRADDGHFRMWSWY